MGSGITRNEKALASFFFFLFVFHYCFYKALDISLITVDIV
jgi:hypothetical protein